MILLDRASYQNQPRYAEYVGLSTDAKPIVSPVSNGDEFQEIDTGKVFKFDIDTVQWYEQPTGGGVSITLESIEIFAPPDKTVYAVGQTFNSTGLEVIARYNIGLSKFITNYTLSPTGPLTADDEFITISYTEGDITKTTQQSITVVEALPVLNDNSWSTISVLSQSGQASAYWAVGDAKQITLNGTVGTVEYNDYQPWVYILGFNHNSVLEGNNLIHFGCFRSQQNYDATNGIALDDQYYVTQTLNDFGFYINKTSINSGGWKTSYIRQTILDSEATNVSSASLNSFLSVLPHELQVVIKSCTKYTDNVGGTNSLLENITATQDWCWLLSEYEVQGTITFANIYEQNYQEQYDYYANGNSKIKFKQSNEEVGRWWLRSLSNEYSYSWCHIDGIGSSSIGFSADFSLCVSPGFCV